MIKILIVIFSLFLSSLSSAADFNIIIANCLTGGEKGCLDRVNGLLLKSGDVAITITATQRFFHSLKTAGCSPENSPATIVPDTDPGSKCWSQIGEDDSHNHGDSTVSNDITLSNLTQITNRSHYVLSDIGSNTHPQIDGHIAATGAAAHGDSYILNSGGDVGTGDYTITGNISVGDGDADNPKVRFIGTTIKEIYFDQTRGALILNAGKVIIE